MIGIRQREEETSGMPVSAIGKKCFLKLICSNCFLLTKSIKKRMERKLNRYWSDFYSHHMCVSNENKTHNLASLTIDDWQQWDGFIAVSLLKSDFHFVVERTLSYLRAPEPDQQRNCFLRNLNPPDIVSHGWGSLINFCVVFPRPAEKWSNSAHLFRGQRPVLMVVIRKFHCYISQIKC